MLVGKAIYNLLSNNANVSALVSTRVYPEVAHQQDVAPYIVYNVRSNEPSDTQLSPSTLDTASVEVNCYAATYETAIAISVAVRGTLDRVQGTYAGVNVQSCQYQSELMNFEEPRRLYVVTADYQVRILRTNVTIPQVMIEAGVYNLDDLSDVNVPAPTDGQALVYDAATSQWVAGDAASALADLTDVNLDEPLDREGLVYDEATTSWINGGPAKVDFPVTNNYAGGIALGTVVAFNGVVQGDRPQVVPFSASSASDPRTLVGIASETMGFRIPGHVRSYGTIYGLNTNAYPVGTILYASTTAGELTSTPPAAPNHRIAIGVVTRQHANTGRIFVRTYTPGYRIGDLSDVSNAAPTSNMVLTWDGTKWAPALPTGGYLPGGSPPPGGYTPAIFYRASDATLAVDEDLTWVAGTNTLTTVNVTGSGIVKGTNTYGARFATEAATNRALADATGVTVERYFTCTAEGNGESFNIQSNTPSSGNRIVRKIWYKNEAFEATDVNTWTLVHTFADNATYASTATQWAATLEAQTYGKPPFTLALSWEEASLFSGLLDDYPGAAAAYSVRLLDKDYTGSCIRVRRASDNKEEDIGFDGNGDLDTGALTSFCTGTNCFVKTWYDQSGNARNATQTTTANQPKIYDSATGVEVKNSVAALNFDADHFTVASSTSTFNNFHNGSNAAFAMVLQPGKVADPNALYVVLGNNNGAVTQRGFEAYFDDRAASSRNNATALNITNGTATYVSFDVNDNKITANSQSLWFAQFDGDNATAALRTQSGINGSALYGVNTSTGTVTASNATNDFQIGASGSGGASFVGYMQELVLWPSDQSTKRSGIETNTNSYFSIY